MTRNEMAVAIVLGLLVNECSEISSWVAVRLVQWAAQFHYKDAPGRAAIRSEELAALINNRPGKLFKLLTALGFALQALATTAVHAAPRELGRLIRLRHNKNVAPVAVIVTIGALGAVVAVDWAALTGRLTGKTLYPLLAWGAVGAMVTAIALAGAFVLAGLDGSSVVVAFAIFLVPSLGGGAIGAWVGPWTGVGVVGLVPVLYLMGKVLIRRSAKPLERTQAR